MLKIFFSIIFFILLTVFETSFIASLPAPFVAIPLVLAVSVYIIQYHGSVTGVWWMAGYGLFLDILGVGSFTGQTFLYLAAGLLAYQLSQHLFTNRSLYGIITSGGVAWLVIVFVQSMVFIYHYIILENQLSFFSLSSFFLSELFFLIIMLVIIFQGSHYIKKRIHV